MGNGHLVRLERTSNDELLPFVGCQGTDSVIDTADDESSGPSTLASQFFCCSNGGVYVDELLFGLAPTLFLELGCVSRYMRCEYMLHCCQHHQLQCGPITGFSESVRLRKFCGKNLNARSPEQFFSRCPLYFRYRHHTALRRHKFCEQRWAVVSNLL